jgi:DNA polymerase-3 subunit alpha
MWEKELLGLYISGHPLDKFRAVLDKRDVNVKKVREEMREGMIAVIGGIIEEARPVITKKNDTMMFIKLADFSGSLEVVVFPKVYSEFKNILLADACIAVKGRISHRNGEVSIVADKVKPLTSGPAPTPAVTPVPTQPAAEVLRPSENEEVVSSEERS